MYKITHTFTDYDGNERTEDFYFNLSKAEVTAMEMKAKGGLQKTLQNIINAKDQARLVEIFEELVLKAYGQKSLDGRKFVKNEELREDFKQTEAYSDIFMMLAFDDKKAADFINGILPSEEDMRKAIKAAGKEIKDGKVVDIQNKE